MRIVHRINRVLLLMTISKFIHLKLQTAFKPRKGFKKTPLKHMVKEVNSFSGFLVKAFTTDRAGNLQLPLVSGQPQVFTAFWTLEINVLLPFTETS